MGDRRGQPSRRSPARPTSAMLASERAQGWKFRVIAIDTPKGLRLRLHDFLPIVCPQLRIQTPAVLRSKHTIRLTGVSATPQARAPLGPF